MNLVKSNLTVMAFLVLTTAPLSAGIFTIDNESRFIDAVITNGPSEQFEANTPGAVLGSGVAEVSQSFPNGASASGNATQDVSLGVTENSITLSGGSFAEFTTLRPQSRSDATITFSVTEPVNYIFSGSVMTSIQGQGHVQTLVSLLDEQLNGISIHNIFDLIQFDCFFEDSQTYFIFSTHKEC